MTIAGKTCVSGSVSDTQITCTPAAYVNDSSITTYSNLALVVTINSPTVVSATYNYFNYTSAC